jgi:hypothetical protein
MLEQGVTIPTCDPRENREAVAALAAQVDPDCEAFYYHLSDPVRYPLREPLRFAQNHVDAMWASIITGKPTINGYTGNFPSGWYPFFLVDSPRGPDVHTALEKWKSTRGLVSSRIQIIGSKCSRQGGKTLYAPTEKEM